LIPITFHSAVAIPVHTMSIPIDSHYLSFCCSNSC